MSTVYYIQPEDTSKWNRFYTHAIAPSYGTGRAHIFYWVFIITVYLNRPIPKFPNDKYKKKVWNYLESWLIEPNHFHQMNVSLLNRKLFYLCACRYLSGRNMYALCWLLLHSSDLINTYCHPLFCNELMKKVGINLKNRSIVFHFFP